MDLARGDCDCVACFQIVRTAVDNHACRAFEEDEEFVHVCVRMGDQDFAGRNDDACDIWVNGGR